MPSERTIHTGYEVRTGTPVTIPLRNLAITGQTQESGKTTTLEALVARAGCRAIAFITKRGESSFADGHRLAPYFRERADWQFVDQLLAAQLREKNKFLRPWLIRICRTTRTLAEVHAAVRKELETAKGINLGVYTQLDAYLDLIVPEIARATLADRMALQPGLNVMDVSAYPTAMQMLFVQSAIDWVNEHERDVVTIVPEAWEMIPQNAGSPVKASAVTLVRKGSGIGNHIWVDSQDMAGVDNVILRGCPVWLIGVQREANEIKRNLANIPASVARPKPAEIALLGRGVFFVCHGQHVIKTYVQPAWMSDRDAIEIARADLDGSVVPTPAAAIRCDQEDPSMCKEHQRLAARVTELEGELSEMTARCEEQVRWKHELGEQVARLEKVEKGVTQLGRAMNALGLAGGGSGSPAAAEPVDVDAIVEKVVARIPTGGTVVQVTPPAKLRADFQREEVDRLMETVNALPPVSRQILKLLEALEGKRISQREAAARLGKAMGGWITEPVRALTSLALVNLHNKHGMCTNVRKKIADDLATYEASDADVEATYQRVLHAIATEPSAAA